MSTKRPVPSDWFVDKLKFVKILNGLLFHPDCPLFCRVPRRHILQIVKSENCALLGCYADSSGNFVPTFRDNLSVPCSEVENP
jgi:hypothetical protein